MEGPGGWLLRGMSATDRKTGPHPGWRDRGGGLVSEVPLVGSNKRPRTARSARTGPAARVRSGADRGRRRGRGRESVWIGREGAREAGVPALGGVPIERGSRGGRSVGTKWTDRRTDAEIFGLWCSSPVAGGPLEALGSGLQGPLRRRLRVGAVGGCRGVGGAGGAARAVRIRSRGPCSRAWAALGAPVGARSGVVRGVWGGGRRQSAGGGS